MKQLRFTTTKPMAMLGLFNPASDHIPLSIPCNLGEFIPDKIRGKTAYIHRHAEDIAGYDIPYFLDGNLGQLDLPVTEQDILMVLPSGEYQCKSEYHMNHTAYLITLTNEPSALI